MAIEPSSVQRDRMLAQGKTKLALAQFLVFRDPAFYRDYLEITRQSVTAEGGVRVHQLKIGQVLTGGELPYQYLTIDSFPSSQALLQAHENTREIRQEALIEIYAIIIKPNPAVKRIFKGLGFLSQLLTKWLGTSETRDIKNLSGLLDPETDPDPGKLSEFGTGNLEQPFYMMNLNQFSARNKQGTSGKAAYNRYSSWITPYLVSVGGYPDIYGEILSTYIGDQKSKLHNIWHHFALVYYPSRFHFLRLMSNSPIWAAEIRRAGLKRVVLMPCSKT
ncbi:MAG: hypothetical protein ACC633_10375 [Anaerolineales bacterium]